MLRHFYPPASFSALLLMCSLFGAPAARGDTDEQPPTLYFQATGGYSVYKSALAQSNDTGVTTAYGFGVNAGANHNIGMFLERESSNIAFALNGSSIAVAWQDVGLRYWLGPVSFGLLVSSSSWAVKEPPRVANKIDATATSVDYVDLTSTGYGANIASRFTMNKRSAVFAEATYAAAGVTQQKGATAKATAAEQAAAQRLSVVGPRMAFNIGGTLGLFKGCDLMAGFKYRTFNLTVDGTANKEQLNTTYAGLLLHASF